MMLRKLTRHTFSIRTFYITNVALLFGFASVLGDFYSSSRSIVVTPKDCTVELRLFSNKSITTDKGGSVWYTYTGEDGNYASYALKYGDLQPDSILDAPLAPRDCDITVTTINGAYEHLRRYAVVNISWSTPSNVTGLHGYVGEVKATAFDRETGTKPFTLHLPRAFVPNLNTSRYLPDTADYYDCLRLPPTRDNSIVRFSSLPHSYNNFVEAYIHYIDTGMSKTDTRSTPTWSTLMVVTCHPQETMVKVRFTAAPQELRFTQYTICHNFSRRSSATIPAYPEEKQPERKFYNIEPGVYQVWLLAQRDKEEILQCDTALSRVNGVAAIVRNIDMTRSIGIHKASSKPIFPSATKSQSHIVDTTDVKGRPTDPSQSTYELPHVYDGRPWTYMTGVVIVLVVLLPTAWLIVVCVKKSSPLKKSSVVSATPTESKPAKEALLVELIDVTTITEQRKLFILYSSDNDSHRRVVDRFALFLQRHCRCAVVLDTWCEQDLAELSPIQWLLRQLRSVDTILVIHSEGGTRRFNAFLEGHVYEKKARDSGYLEDIFVPAVKLLINDQQGGTLPKTRRVFNAYFSYSNKKTGVIDAMRGQTYELMRNIEELILLIHGQSKSSKIGVSRVPIINYKEFISVAEGKDLVKAIDAAERYHTNFPGWFDSIYMKSDCDTLQSSSETALLDTVSSPSDFPNENPTDIGPTDITQTYLEHRIDRANGMYYTNSDIDDVCDSGLVSGFDNSEAICHQECTLLSNNEKKQFNQAVLPGFRQFRACPRSISMTCESDPGYIHDNDDGDADNESGCPYFIKPDSMYDDTSSIDSLTYDNTAREFNEDAESS